MKLNKKGFSLIEVLAVVIIMGVLLIIVIPAITKIMARNRNREFDYYYKAVENATLAYSDYLVDRLGTSNDDGCLENDGLDNNLGLSLDVLINRELLTEFNKEGITCSINDAYIKNTKGKITYSVGFSCSDKNGIVYEHKYEAPKSCTPYEYQGENNIKTTIKNDTTHTVESGRLGNQVFISGNSNNYVWYSGMLWRVYSYNENTETVKLISNDSVTISDFSTTETNTYTNSSVYTWLNYSFLPKLRDTTHYLLNTRWVVDNNETTSFSRIGLMSTMEFYKASNYANNSSWWLSGRDVNNKVSYVYDDYTLRTTASTYYLGVRPVIAMYSDIYITGGNGTEYNPYRLAGDDDTSEEIKGNFLNTRYVGEYVSFSNYLYRIIDITNGYIKIAKDTPYDEDIVYDTNSYNEYTFSSIGSFFMNNWYNKLSQKSLVTFGDFCVEQFSGVIADTCTKLENTTAVKVGLIRPGDIYYSSWKQPELFEWTMLKNNNESEVLVLTSDYTFDYSETNVYAFARPVLYLNNTVKIKNGTGVKNNPFIIE